MYRPGMRSLVAVLSVAALGCGPITPVVKDAGSGGGSGGGLGGGFAQGGGTAGGSSGGVAGGNSGGGATSGGSAGGQGGGAAGGQGGGTAGGSGGGAPGLFTWANLVAMPAPSSFAIAVAVAGRSNEIYVGFDNGRLYRSTGAAFQEVVGGNLSGLKDLYVSPSGKVYVVSSGRTASHCLATDCSIGTNFTVVNSAAGTGTEAFTGLCGSGERVFAVGMRDTNNVGVLYEFDGVSTWTKVSNNLGITRPQGCQLTASGEVIAVGDLGVVRYDQGATTPEPIDTTGQPQAIWTSLTLAVENGVTVEGFIGGSGSGSRYARRNNASGTWTSLPPVTTGPSISVIAALSTTEVLAAGFGTPKFTSWNGTAFVPTVPAPPNTIGSVRDMAVISSREVFLVGSDGQSSYTIIRGRR